MKVVVPSGIGPRLAEKTVELTFASQAGQRLGTGIWFGLTQKQEAAQGYDAALSMGARLIYFQFKVSNRVLATGIRQFRLSHQQLKALQMATPVARTVFYVLPDVGTHAELASNGWDLLAQCWFLDVADIAAAIAPPTTRLGKPRRSGHHYADLSPSASPPSVTIHSEPTRAPLIPADVLLGEELRRPPIILIGHRPSLERFWEIRGALGRNALAVAVQT